MVELDIVTPVTRPQNLGEIGMSLKSANHYFDVFWYKIHDCKVGGCKDIPISCIHGVPGPPEDAGWTQRNWHLDHGRPQAWVYWHDDDTEAHPDLFKDLAESIAINPKLKAIVYAMKYVHLPGQPIMVGQPGNVQIGTISGSMVIFRRDFVQDEKAWPERMADGMFWQKVMRNANLDEVLWTNKPYILFNSMNPSKPE
jgi:hypothetical protein